MKVSIVATSLEEAREAARKRVPSSLPLHISTISYVVERPPRSWPGDALPAGKRVLGVREFVFNTELLS